MNTGMTIGEKAWRITGGKYAGKICWLNEVALKKADQRKLFKVQLVQENVPYYGTWGGDIVMVLPKYLKKITYVGKWSDQ